MVVAEVKDSAALNPAVFPLMVLFEIVNVP